MDGDASQEVQDEEVEFKESQIVTVLKEADAGITVERVCRRHGISRATYYARKSK